MTVRQIDRACRGERDVKRRKSKNPRKAAVLRADKYASLDVRLDGKCVLAGWDKINHECKGPLVCGHLFSRVAYSTRWEESNLYCICSWANIRMESDPVVARQLLEYAEALWGEQNIEALHLLYNTAKPMKTYEILELADQWQSKYEKHLAWRGEV
jgi:hypothetical protein